MAIARRYEASNGVELEPIAGWIDDSYSATDQLFFDANRGELRVAFENNPPADDAVGFAARTLIKRTIFARHFRQPYFRCLLTIRRVVAVEPPIDNLDEPVTFSHPDWSAEEGTIYFASNTDSAFLVRVSAFDVELEVSDEIAYYRKYVAGHFPIVWDADGHIVD